MTDSEKLDFLDSEFLDLRCISISNGDAGDADVMWVVIQHHMAAPKEREVGRGATARKAILDAIQRKEF